MFNIQTPSTTDVIELKEFCHYIENNVSLGCQKSLLGASLMFKKLYNNRSFLAEFIQKELKNGYKGFQDKNSYTPPSLILARHQDFFLRANIWLPSPVIEEGNINVYGLMHDHNFDFLTLNYHGPGYTSKMFEYDRKGVVGKVGEKIELFQKGTLLLNEGDVFLYRKGIDIHSQCPPKEMSVTLNLMVTKEELQLKNQYIIDSETSRILQIKGSFESKKFIYDLAMELGNEDTKDLLYEIKSHTNCDDSKKYISKELGL